MSKKFYRPEIDGLRALAIIPVVLFHAGIFGFAGGFVGVDIFFVISGFLITSILLRELRAGTFSFMNFWERRIRRIFPALFVVLMVTAAITYALPLFPQDFMEFAKSLFAQSLFISNLFFMRKEGYFAAPSETAPLLHTWTLSVEEQFYILLPVLLFLLWKFFKAKIVPTLFVFVIFSFVLSVYLVNLFPGDYFTAPYLPDVWRGALNQTVGFYMLPTRAWELMVGALLAASAFAIHSKKVAEVGSMVGVFAIAYAVTQYSAAIQFPGVAALLPVMGAALIIASNTHMQTRVGRMLSWPGLVWVGLISYSLYLWHWPVFVYAKILFPEENVVLTFALILLSVILAWATYKFIETPFGQRKYIPHKRTMVGVGLVSLLVCVGVSYGLRNVDVHKFVSMYAEEVSGVQEQGGAQARGMRRSKRG